MVVSPWSIIGAVVSSDDHRCRSIHERRGYNHGRGRIDDGRRGSHHNGRRRHHHRHPDPHRDPDARMRGQRHGGNHEAGEESTHPEPMVCALHTVSSFTVASRRTYKPGQIFPTNAVLG
jgi:hypothetical protein